MHSNLHHLQGIIDSRRLYAGMPPMTAPVLAAAGVQPSTTLAGLLPPRPDPSSLSVLSLIEAQYMQEKADILMAMEKTRLLKEARMLNKLELQRAMGLASHHGLQTNLMQAIEKSRTITPEVSSSDDKSSDGSSSGTEISAGSHHHHQRAAFAAGVAETPVTDLRMRQDDSWETRFNELLEFKEETGHCNVPRRYKLNPKLGVWVCSLRQQMTRGTLNKAKVERLNQIGFQWRITVIKGAQINPQIAKIDTWNERLQLLISFKRMHGHCNVPCVHRKLSKWVQAQRRQKKMGKLSIEREEKLNAIGFDWKNKKHSVSSVLMG